MFLVWLIVSFACAFSLPTSPVTTFFRIYPKIILFLESGRLFVWGENQYGQLSAGSKEVITKPSCVKEIKNLGYKVRNIAFGEAFSVILTGNFSLFALVVFFIVFSLSLPLYVCYSLCSNECPCIDNNNNNV